MNRIQKFIIRGLRHSFQFEKIVDYALSGFDNLKYMYEQDLLDGWDMFRFNYVYRYDTGFRNWYTLTRADCKLINILQDIKPDTLEQQFTHNEVMDETKTRYATGYRNMIKYIRSNTVY